LFPENLGEKFLELYKSIIKERILAKKKANELQSRIKTLEKENEKWHSQNDPIVNAEIKTSV